MSGRREALVVAVDEYGDSALRKLRAPSHDADALARVLGDSEIGNFNVRQLRNEPAHVISEALEEFFADRDRDDVLLVYFSGHGLKDEDGTLQLAASNTKVGRLAATSVSAAFVNQQMSRSRSRRIVLMLDCCYAGAFARGLTPRGAASDLGIDRQLGGSGRAVITASSAMEYAFEGSVLTGTAAAEGPSVFTGVLVRGLETGEADRDGDGVVTLDEIYDYVYAGVRDVTPHQTPGKWIFNMQGSLHIAQRPTSTAGAGALTSRTRPARFNAAVRRRPRQWAAVVVIAGLMAAVVPLVAHGWPWTGAGEASGKTEPPGPVIFADDFTTRKGGWPDIHAAVGHGGYYRQGAYRYFNREPGKTWWANPTAAAIHPQAPSSVRVMAWGRWSGFGDYAWFGIACRVVGDSDAYIFTVADGIAHIVRMRKGGYDDELVTVALREPDLHRGVQLEADCTTTDGADATRLVFRVNGQKVAEYLDNKRPLVGGTVGVVVEMHPSAVNAEAEFKNFTVSRL